MDKSAATPPVLRANLGDRPATRAIFTGEVASPAFRLNFVGPKRVTDGFKPMIRDRAYDISEIPVATYLQARFYGKPIVLLPAVVLGRFQHAFIGYRENLGKISPKALEGRRVAVRAYSVTTGMWVRSILQHDYDVALDKITWVTYEDPHLAEFGNPPNVERIDLAGRQPEDLLRDGTVDAAISSTEVEAGSGILPLFSEEDARGWYRRHGVVPINHLVAVADDLARSQPELVREIYALLKESRKRSVAEQFGVDVLPFGVSANRKPLESAIQYCLEQKLIGRPMSVDELFDEATRNLDD